MSFLKRAGVAAVVAGLALAAMLMPTEAAEVVDQQVNALPSDGSTNWNQNEGINNIEILGQTFKPTKASITKVELYLQPKGAATTTGPVDVTLAVKRPAFTALVTKTITVPNGSSAGWYTFDFDTTPLTAGTEYEFQVTVNDDTKNLAWGYTNAGYADGEGYHAGGGIKTPKTFDFLFKAYADDCGSILFGVKPPAAGGFGTFAINCGTLAELVTASGCPQATATFFYNKPDGKFVVYIPGSAVAIVNAEFLAIFNGTPAIKESTIFIGKCV